MPNNPKITVVMPVYNGEKYLKEAIESILNQTFTDFEFIIINDGSTDSSFEIIQNYEDERIKIINNEKNIGLTKSLNKALKVARSEYIARQDADDVSLPNRFERQTRYFEKYPELALVGTSIYEIDENGNTIGKNIALTNPGIKNLLRGNKFTHGSVMFKKKVIDRLGGYNESLKYAQDYELWLRIAKHYEVRNLPDTLYQLRSHSKKIGVSTSERELALYWVLAQKLAKDDINQEALKAIKDKHIESLYSDLNKGERVHFHQTVAGLYEKKGDLDQAKEDYKKVLSLSPFDVKNNINLVHLYLKGALMIKSYKIRRTIRNFLRYLRNLLVY
ncbi:hypothetical protein ES702_00075 [subsurface metagenome]